MEAQLKEFIRDLKERQNRSENTLLSYERDIRQLLRWLEPLRIVRAEAVSPMELKNYILYLQESGKTASTISRCVASIRAYFLYLTERGVLIRDPAETLRAPRVVRKAPQVVSEEEVRRLLAQPDERTAKGLRDKAMLELLCHTGMRVSELITLRLDEVDAARRLIAVEAEEASKCRQVPCQKRMLKLLQRYVRDARPKLILDETEELLFVNCSGEKMTRQGFWKVLKQYGRAAGIETEITPHVMRHSYAVHALACGGDVRRIQELMGRKDSAGMHRYVILSEQFRP